MYQNFQSDFEILFENMTKHSHFDGDASLFDLRSYGHVHLRRGSSLHLFAKRLMKYNNDLSASPYVTVTMWCFSAQTRPGR